MLTDFNLIVTAERGFESEAMSALWMLLRELGDERPIIDRAPVRGMILARTSLDPVKAITLLREELSRSPQDFRNIFRVLPVHMVVRTEIESIAQAARELSSRMGEHESFRITVEKRRTGLRSREIIEAVAAGISQKVDLEHPDWVVLVEVVGKFAGVSVLAQDAILNVQKERAQLTAPG